PPRRDPWERPPRRDPWERPPRHHLWERPPRRDRFVRRCGSRGAEAAPTATGKRAVTARDADLIVVGAGLAGLAAAPALEAEGLDVLVLEAQDRVGGRVHSMRQLGANAEAGGTYIGAGYTRVIGAANRYGVPLIDVTP